MFLRSQIHPHLSLSDTSSAMKMRFQLSSKTLIITGEAVRCHVQEKQCMYTVTLRSFHTTVVEVEKHYVLHNISVYSLRYSACNTQAPYFHLWPLRFCNIFPQYLTKGTIFGKKFIDHKIYVSTFPTTYVWKVSHYKHCARYDQKCISVWMWSTRYSCQLLIKLEFCKRIFEKYSSTEFLENPSSRSRADWQRQNWRS